MGLGRGWAFWSLDFSIWVQSKDQVHDYCSVISLLRRSKGLPIETNP